jgi:hypothetical protein
MSKAYVATPKSSVEVRPGTAHHDLSFRRRLIVSMSGPGSKMGVPLTEHRNSLTNYLFIRRKQKNRKVKDTGSKLLNKPVKIWAVQTLCVPSRPPVRVALICNRRSAARPLLTSRALRSKQDACRHRIWTLLLERRGGLRRPAAFCKFAWAAIATEPSCLYELAMNCLPALPHDCRP